METHPDKAIEEERNMDVDTVSSGVGRSNTGSQPLTTTERRRHWRVGVNLLGRFMRENKQEYPCKILNMSPGGAAMMTPDEGEVGEHIVAYIDHIGRVEGTIARTFSGGFAMKLDATPYKKEKIASQLTWLANKNLIDLSEGRRHERLVPKKADAIMEYGTGETVSCRLIDVSLSGASVEIEERPQIGMDVLLGKMRGRVVRHHEKGVGIEFLDIQNPKALRSYFG